MGSMHCLAYFLQKANLFPSISHSHTAKAKMNVQFSEAFPVRQCVSHSNVCQGENYISSFSFPSCTDDFIQLQEMYATSILI